MATGCLTIFWGIILIRRIRSLSSNYSFWTICWYIVLVWHEQNKEVLGLSYTKKSYQFKLVMICLKFKQYQALLSKQNKDTATREPHYPAPL